MIRRVGEELEERKIIKVEANEFSIKKAKKEAKKAEKKGFKVAYDLRGIKDKEILRDIILFTKD